MKKAISKLFFLLIFVNKLYSQDSVVYDLIEVDRLPKFSKTMTLKKYLLKEFYKSGVMGEMEFRGTLKLSFVLTNDLKINSIQSNFELNNLIFQKFKELSKKLLFESPAYKNRKKVNTRIYLEIEIGQIEE